jgi:nucleoside-diphosphate-sugar epimerase
VKLLVTGATGFVGRYTVAAALGRGHEVRAVVRPSSSTGALGSLLDEPAIELVRVDLRNPAGLVEALDGVDAVIHLAAAKSGDFYTQFAGTVMATENLLGAMGDAGVRHLVAVSTFSVYDYLRMKAGTVVTESSPIDTSPGRRDEYAQTKLLQEELYWQFGAERDNRMVIVRPGMIYGRDNLWHALLGAELGPRFLKIGSKATLPLLYVENCAEALAMAAERLIGDPSPVDAEVVNLVDDDLPTQAEYVELVSAVMDPPPSIPVPWPVMRLAAGAIAGGNALLVGGRAKFPGIVVPDRLHARFKPLRYTNAKAKRSLGWLPRYPTADAIRRSAGDDDLLGTTARGRAASESISGPVGAAEPGDG